VIIRLHREINYFVFITSTVVIALITGLGSFWPEASSRFFKLVQFQLISYTSWIYVLSVGSLLFFSFWLMVSRYGDIKLGPDHSAPEYSKLSWFAMLFSAGMGIGLLFWGVAEPIMHLSQPPIGEPFSLYSAREAMKITFFHWGLHAWSIYAVFAVILAYFSYRKNLPLLPRSAFYPFLGQRIFGITGDLIDTFAVISTLFGVATSLGLGVTQVNAGLHYLFEVPQTVSVQVLLISGITLLATVSVVLGLDGGIKRLSNLNMFLAVGLLVFILVLGPTVDLLQSYIQNTGTYLSDIVYKTFNLYAYEKREDWIGGWTLLYWGWWVSWAPFVGMFIARISKGRTIREFLWGVLLVPSGFTFLWMTVLGNSAIDLVLNQGAVELSEAVNSNVSIALFKFLEYFPLSQPMTIISLLLIVTFFVSSSDSGSLVIDTLSSGGAAHPPVWQRIYWALMEGFVAAALLLSGGLEALQTATIASAFPMMFLLLMGCWALVKSLKSDYLLSDSIQNHSTVLHYSQTSTTWKNRLNQLVSLPSQKEISTFMETCVSPALRELCAELKAKNLNVVVEKQKKDFVQIRIKNKAMEDFVYGVQVRPYTTLNFLTGKPSTFYRAEVYLLHGGQDYDVYGYSSDQVIADAIQQYEKHLHYLHLSHSQSPDDN
jgi:choline/glycine/proline betaine transport protein